MKKIKISSEICSTCKYRMGFGSNGNRTTKNNVACNYLQIRHESRIFENGKLRIDPEYCDKYEEGDKIPYDFGIVHAELDEYALYKSRRLRMETKGQL